MDIPAAPRSRELGLQNEALLRAPQPPHAAPQPRTPRLLLLPEFAFADQGTISSPGARRDVALSRSTTTYQQKKVIKESLILFLGGLNSPGSWRQPRFREEGGGRKRF